LKKRLARKYINEIEEFREKLCGLKSKEALLKNSESDAAIRQKLLVAAGFSEKALKHVAEKDQKEIIEEFVRNFSDGDFLNKILLNYTLAKGAALDGEVRNAIGRAAVRKLIERLAKRFRKLRIEPSIYFDESRESYTIKEALENLDENEKAKIRYIQWHGGNGARALCFDKNRRNLSVQILISFCSSLATEIRKVLKNH
jgi:hypothetical protein